MHFQATHAIIGLPIFLQKGVTICEQNHYKTTPEV